MSGKWGKGVRAGGGSRGFFAFGGWITANRRRRPPLATSPPFHQVRIGGYSGIGEAFLALRQCLVVGSVRTYNRDHPHSCTDRRLVLDARKVRVVVLLVFAILGIFFALN